MSAISPAFASRPSSSARLGRVWAEAVKPDERPGASTVSAVRFLRSRWRRQLHLPEPVVGRLGETPRPLDELTGLSVKADAVDDDRRRVGGPAPVEVADDDVEPVELRLVVLVDRARESAEGAVGVDRADESTLGRQVAVREIERHRGGGHLLGRHDEVE